MGKNVQKAIFKDTIVPKTHRELFNHYFLNLPGPPMEYQDLISQIVANAEKALRRHGFEADVLGDPRLYDPGLPVEVFEAQTLLINNDTLEVLRSRLHTNLTVGQQETLDRALSMAIYNGVLTSRIVARRSEKFVETGRKVRSGNSESKKERRKNAASRKREFLRIYRAATAKRKPQRIAWAQDKFKEAQEKFNSECKNEADKITVDTPSKSLVYTWLKRVRPTRPSQK